MSLLLAADRAVFLGGLSALKGGPQLLEAQREGPGPHDGSGSQKAGPLVT